MPGRRRRRKSRKHSLVFTESPVNNQRHVPTPVLCVDNPITAKQVPVDGDQTWVSPQFRDLQRSIRGRRHVRKYHSTILTRSRHHSNKENTSAINPNYRNKYNSLKFLGDRSVDSVVEDISFDSPSPVKTKRKSTAVPNFSFDTPITQPNSWSLKRLKKSRKSFNISFNESLTQNVQSLNQRPLNHTLNVSPLTCARTCNTKEGKQCDNTCTPTTRRSARLQDKYLQTFQIFKTPPNRKDGVSKILAYDTPECEYNLSVRERQLRKKTKL
ncbi:hypothetical protein SNE40_006699 [Patella caerulea]|uniref:Uncharacterized protein n=1 Tax=Patella caerulea TaxID=87958 RepID=A0AAN8JX15_PATCE